MSNSFSSQAQTGFAAASLYDAHRPSYSSEAVEELLSYAEVLGVEGAVIVDLAAGTGKLTEVLAARPEKYAITAIDPHTEMLDILKKKQLKSVEVVSGTAEDMSMIKSESVAVVTVAQGMHWIANMSALKEIHRVLQGTGVLGMIWNVEDYNAPLSWDVHPGWESAMRDEVQSLDDGHPRFRNEKWKAVFDEQNSGNPLTSDPMFGLPLGEKSIEDTIWLTKDETWKRFRTLSQISILEGNELETMQKKFFNAIDGPETEVDEQGRIAVHTRTYFAWCSKIPTVPLMSDQAM